MTVWKALIVTGLFLPIVLAFLYLILLRVFVAPIVYATIILCDVSVLGCTLYCFAKARGGGAALGRAERTLCVSCPARLRLRFPAARRRRASSQAQRR